MDDSATRPLLILDLDETLIHGAEEPLHRDADFTVGPFYVYKRPHLESFLANTTPHFDVAIWSSASSDYVSGIASALASLVPTWQFVWSRERCVQRMHPEMMTTMFIKDLRKVKRRGHSCTGGVRIYHGRIGVWIRICIRGIDVVGNAKDHI